MQCARSSEELTSLMDGELSPQRAAELRRHVAGCAACRRELIQLKQTASLVGALAEVAPPADLRARVEHKAAQPRAAAALACAGVGEVLDEYAHGDLAPETADGVHAHLLEGEACSRELARVEQSAGLLGTLAEVSPPARIRERVQREVARRSRPVYARPMFRGMMATMATAAAAATVILVMRVPAPMEQPTVLPERPAAAEESVTPEAPVATTPTAPAEPTVTAAEREARPVFRRGEVSALGYVSDSRATRRPTSGREGAERSAVAAALADVPTADAEPTPRTTDALPADPRVAPVSYFERERVISSEEALAGLPLETPAPEPAAADAGPVAEPESAVAEEPLPRAHPARDATRASVVPAVDTPLAEVRRVLREQRRSEPPTLRPQRKRDWFASGPISPWGY